MRLSGSGVFMIAMLDYVVYNVGTMFLILRATGVHQSGMMLEGSGCGVRWSSVHSFSFCNLISSLGSVALGDVGI